MTSDECRRTARDIDVLADQVAVDAGHEVVAVEVQVLDLGVQLLEAPKGETPDDWEPVELTLFRSTQFGDDQDRPMKKSDGSWTYFGADAAYHLQKAEGADHLVNIWGADHAGTVKRVQAAVKALTDGRVDLDVKLVQMVRLFRAGEPVKMSKRAGDFVTLAEVVEEVGKDVVRFHAVYWPSFLLAAEPGGGGGAERPWSARRLISPVPWSWSRWP